MAKIAFTNNTPPQNTGYTFCAVSPGEVFLPVYEVGTSQSPYIRVRPLRSLVGHVFNAINLTGGDFQFFRDDQPIQWVHMTAEYVEIDGPVPPATVTTTHKLD